jgi:hypothetical protein
VPLDQVQNIVNEDAEERTTSWTRWAQLDEHSGVGTRNHEAERASQVILQQDEVIFRPPMPQATTLVTTTAISVTTTAISSDWMKLSSDKAVKS